MPPPIENNTPENAPFAVHLLDVGAEEYGDAILCQFGNVSVLIDGAHPSDWDGSRAVNGTPDHEPLPTQISRLLGATTAPTRVTLLIVSHVHQDHIGCLPRLVEHGLLTADWALVAHPQLGWGRALDESPAPFADDERTNSLVAALREETRQALNDATTKRFLQDAATLETRYLAMLQQLAANGTKVIPYPQPNPTEVLALQQFLAAQGVGLKLLGPSLEQALLCAELIHTATRRATQRVTDLVGLADALSPIAPLTPAQLYRQLTATPLPDAANAAAASDAAVSRPGPPVNLLSLVTLFTYRERKFLFTGDMQFTKPQVSAARIRETVAALRQQVAAEAPYAFAKISHHGSDNAFDESFLRDLGATPLLGLCAGEKSTAHPHPATLAILDRARNAVDWARTDRNRLATFDFSVANPQITVARGTLDDAQPNAPHDQETIGPAPATAVTETSTAAPPSAGATTASNAPPSTPTAMSSTLNENPAPSVPPSTATHHKQPDASSTEYVEVIARVPHKTTRVTITIDVAPNAEADGIASSVAPPVKPLVKSLTTPQLATDALPALRLAGGRVLPPLLFVTCRPKLAANIGQAECDHILQTMRAANWRVLELPVEVADIHGTAALVRQALQAPNFAPQGVVLLGGYDVLPAQRLDCLTPELRGKIRAHHDFDFDNFIVWSDSVYGDMDGDGLAELPVSRIPDGRSAQLVFAALQADSRRAPVMRRGIRNMRRPFAEEIYQLLPGDEVLRQSQPQTANQPAPYTLDADCVYLMLHGDYADTSRFWGEDTPANYEAVNVSNIPLQAGEVIFTGCCWGALTVDTPAGRILAGRGWGVRTPEQSLALTFLLRGAKAFIGCTGVHYSPSEAPYNYLGGPMHRAFWANHSFGKSPARTLFEAKRLYLLGMHERAQAGTSALRLAIENKILRQYTCLGLGW